jgi:hypothetical protein
VDEKELWERFCQNGRINDYLEYRNCVNSLEKTEMKPFGKANCTGSGHKGAEYR